MPTSATVKRLRKDKTQIAEVAARLEAELYAVLTERNVQADEIERLRAQIKEWEEWAKQFKGRTLEPKP